MQWGRRHLHGEEVTPPWKPLWLKFRRVRGLLGVTPERVVGHFCWHHFERTQTLEAEREGEILTGGVGGVGGAVVVWGEERGEIWRIQHNF